MAFTLKKNLWNQIPHMNKERKMWTAGMHGRCGVGSWLKSTEARRLGVGGQGLLSPTCCCTVPIIFQFLLVCLSVYLSVSISSNWLCC